ncbi:hypothetical protein Tco_1516982 [Tanacetum coccineum]
MHSGHDLLDLRVAATGTLSLDTDNYKSLQYRPRLGPKDTETLKGIQPIKGTQLSSVQRSFPSVGNTYPNFKDLFRGVEESYGDTYSRGTRAKYRDQSRDEDRFRSVKRWRESESQSSESSTGNGGHWKLRTKRRKLVDEDDLVVPGLRGSGYDHAAISATSKTFAEVALSAQNVNTMSETETHERPLENLPSRERWNVAMPTW